MAEPRDTSHLLQPQPPDRETLARAQASLVAALAGRTSPPEGFDVGRLRAAAQSLDRKRRRSAERAWPAMAASLGPAFDPAFDVYAAATPLPAGGPADDARAFAESLRRRNKLPAAGVRVLAVDRARRGWPIRFVRGTGIAVLAMRLPVLGLFALPIRWRRQLVSGVSLPA